jgi:hypothetical protein
MSVRQVAMELAPIFRRNGSQNSSPPSSALSLELLPEPQPLSNPLRGISTARQREPSTLTAQQQQQQQQQIDNDADGVHSPPAL